MQSHEQQSDEALSSLVFETASQSCRFLVEIARTVFERERGLMNRRELALDRGMLFLLEGEQEVSFWMKDTYIPLGLIFIDCDGIVLRVVENARPHSIASIPSRVPVRAVLEVNAGTTVALGIKAGDRVLHAAFGTGHENP